MKRTLSALVLLTTTACTPAITVMEPVASHTLRSGPDTDTDIVWIEIYDPSEHSTKLYRCRQGATAPECQLASADR